MNGKTVAKLIDSFQIVTKKPQNCPEKEKPDAGGKGLQKDSGQVREAKSL